MKVFGAGKISIALTLSICLGYASILLMIRCAPALADSKTGPDFPPHVVKRRGGCVGFGPLMEQPGLMEEVEKETKGYFLHPQKKHDKAPEARIWFDSETNRFKLGTNEEPKLDDLFVDKSNLERAAMFFYESADCQTEKNYQLAARFMEESLRLLESENQPVLRRHYVRHYIELLKQMGDKEEAQHLTELFKFDRPWPILPQPMQPGPPPGRSHP